LGFADGVVLFLDLFWADASGFFPIASRRSLTEEVLVLIVFEMWAVVSV